MYSRRINKIIEKLLGADERIIWHSKPIPHTLWRDNTVGAMIIGVILTAVFSCLLCNFIKDGFFITLILLVPLFLFGVFVLMTPWRQKWNFYGKYYLLTNHRVIVIESYYFFHRFFDYKIDDIISMEIEELDDGLYNIDFGNVKCFSCISYRCVGRDGLVNFHIPVKFYFLPKQCFFLLINHLPQDKFVIFKKINGEWMNIRWKNPQYADNKKLESYDDELSW